MSRRSAERVDAVLQATADVLADVGYSALTIDAVAARAQSSKATIYKRWPSKTALIVAVAAKLGPVSIPVLDDSHPLAASITAITRAVRELTTGRFGQIALALNDAGRSEPIVMAAVEEHLAEPQRQAISAALAKLQMAGRINARLDTNFAANVLLTVIVDQALAQGQAMTDEQLQVFVDEWVVPVMAPKGCDSPNP